MQEFREKFIEDATDLIADLESSILELENTPDDSESINQIHRVMHTLKGVSGMYGFDNIGKLTHLLESIYDYIREGKYNPEKQILNLTLESVDNIRGMLKDGDNTAPQYIADNQRLQEKVKTLIEKIEGGQKTNPENLNQTPQNQDQSGELFSYWIQIFPGKNIFTRSVNMLATLEELHELGQAKVIAYLDNVPLFEKLVPENCYTCWDVLLCTDQGKNALEDVFIFIDNQYKIETLSTGNALENQALMSYIESRQEKGLRPDSDELLRLSGESPTTPKEKTRPTPEKPDDKPQPKQQETEDIQPTASKIKEQQKRAQAAGSHVTSNIKVASEKLDDLMNLVSELVTSMAELRLIDEKKDFSRLGNLVGKFDKLTRRFRDNALEIRLIPIENLILRFRRLVRDLSAELGKEIEFITDGMDTELDKNIIYSLSSPMMHILRNSIDHGIESREKRIALGKPPHGTIRLHAYHSGTNVVIEICDDGAGIDMERVRQKAVKKGYIAHTDKPTESDLLEIIFRPGFSTTENLSEVSGRGVGMDVVNRLISKIQGQIEIETRKNQGTTIYIKLPQTLSIIDTLHVTVGESCFLIPLSVVKSCSEAPKSALQANSNKRFELDGELIPFISLREMFKIDQNAPNDQKIVVINHESRLIGLAVDAVIGEHQAVLKPLGEIFKDKEFLSGASILGDGSVALVLDTVKLINFRRRQKKKIHPDKAEKTHFAKLR